MPATAQTAPTIAPSPAQLFMRWIPEFLGNYALTLGGAPVTVPLDQVGYLDMLIVHVKGAFTGATASLVFNQMMPWNIINQFLVQPPGQTPPFRLGGQMLHIWNLLGSDFAPFVNGRDLAAPGTVDANAYDVSIMDVFPVATGAQVVHLWYVLPFHRSSLDIRGVLPLGNRTRTNLVMTPATKAAAVTTAANLTLDTWSVDVFQAYYTPPPAGSGAVVDDAWAITYDETNQVVASVGQQTIAIVPDDTILGIVHAVCLNNTMDSADVSALSLQVNQSWFTDPKGLQADAFNFIQRRLQGTPLPVGIFAYEDDVDVDSGRLDSRKWLHTGQVQKITSYIQIAPGAVLGAGPLIYTSVRRLVDLNPASHLVGAG
jgi:hypothetical protein